MSRLYICSHLATEKDAVLSLWYSTISQRDAVEAICADVQTLSQNMQQPACLSLSLVLATVFLQRIPATGVFHPKAVKGINSRTVRDIDML